MPAVAAAAVAAAVAAKGTVAYAIAYGLTFAVVSAGMSMAVSVVSSLAMSAMSDSSSDAALGSSSLAYDSENRTQMVKQAITAWRTIYGEVKVSGPITFLHTTGETNNKCHIVLTLACHEIDSVGDIYFGDELVFFDTAHNASGRWNGYARCWVGTGSIAGDAELQAALEANCPGVWTSAHRQYGRAKLCVEFTYDQTMFAGGIPQVTCVVKGKKVFDPRTGLTVWSANPALCIRDYMVLSGESGGVGATASEILEAETVASATVSDEQVVCVNSRLVSPGAAAYVGTMSAMAAAFDGTSSTTSAYSASGAVPATIGRAWTSPKTIGRVQVYSPSGTGWVSGSTGSVTLRLRGSNDGAAWATLAETTVYDSETQQSSWMPDPDDIDTSHAYSHHDIEITSASGGTAYVSEIRFFEQVGTEVRYALNGTVDHDQMPKTILPKMLSACAGTLINSGGKWSILAGYYRPPALTLTDDDFTGPIRVAARQSRADSFNAVKGTYISPDHDWVATDAPPVRNGAYEVEDGGNFEAASFDLAADAMIAASVVPVATALQVWSEGTLPSPLLPETIYYAIPQATPGTIKLAASRSDAFDGVAIALGGSPSGANRVRYGVVVWSDTEAPYTVSPSMYQRLGKIKLERGRQGITVEVPCKLRRALRVRVGDTVRIDRPRFGWSNKVFEVSDWTFAVQQDAEGAPLLGVTLILRETSSSVWNWDAGEEVVVDPAPSTSLPALWDVVAPGAITAVESVHTTGNDATLHSTLTVSWVASATASVVEYEVETRPIGTAAWTQAQTATASALSAPIANLAAGDYDIRVRAVTGLGAQSRWSYATVTVGGVPTLPNYGIPSISGLELANQGNNTTWIGKDAVFDWRWSSATGAFDLASGPADSGWRDAYFAGYRIRVYAADGTLIRTEPLQSEARYIYTHERNIADGARRSIVLGVTAQDIYGRESVEARLPVSNPAPAVPSGIRLTPGIDAVFVEFVPPSDTDLAGNLVWASTTSGFAPSDATRVYDGLSSLVTIPRTGAHTWYVRVASYDTFGGQVLNISSEMSATSLLVTGDDIANATIGSAKIADAAITAAKIADATITAAKIADASITAAKIGDATITAAKIADATITSAKVANAAITAAKIADAAITAAKIADAAITSAKIGNAAITSAKIGNAEVDTLKIAGNSVTVSSGVSTTFSRVSPLSWRSLATSISVTVPATLIIIGNYQGNDYSLYVNGSPVIPASGAGSQVVRPFQAVVGVGAGVNNITLNVYTIGGRAALTVLATMR